MEYRQQRINRLEKDLHELQGKTQKIEQALYREKNMVQEYINAVKRYPDLEKLFIAFRNKFKDSEELAYEVFYTGPDDVSGAGYHRIELDPIGNIKGADVQYGYGEVSFKTLILTNCIYSGEFLTIIFKFEKTRKIVFNEQAIDTFKFQDAWVQIKD